MFLGYIEIPKHETRYLDLSEEKKAELMRKKRRRRRRKKVGSDEGDKEKMLKCETLHSSTQKTRKKAKKAAIKIEFNDGNPLRNWDYVANNYKTN
ncbi:hypothetical protein CN923_18695 [Bacillus cereus]|nr:hypothetical protein CON44_15080 [Bacillus cereus]PFK27155.1 hypothetical protein COJ05_10235 [Bacillus cereus]PFP60731.1 hypothetical protein COK09_10180 [Bacillus cereus]PFV18705.1 hypothetical protein COK97_17055 [Bacillus cereus]PGK85902.1 hypothetical protein CN924_00680 [Bacillus cereus]